MKQILHSMKSGQIEIADVPCPAVGRGQILIRSTRSLISPGTERMLVEFGKAGWTEKVLQQPDRVRAVLDKARTDGLLPVISAVHNKLDQAVPLGYCNVGRVLEVGAGVTGFVRGDRVASNGCHAEVVSVPVNLCAKIPDEVRDDEAAFTVLGAIALQGLRLAQPTLGETIVVTGLGLIGLIAAQLLVRGNGCRVLGVDYDRGKLALGRKLGADVVDLSAGDDPVAAAERFSRGRGVDAVIVTASTKSSEPIHQAALMCRKRGRIVLIGVTGLELSRADFYEKELTFQVSCSYGAGRYDPLYEDKGQDYPVGYVRWTAQRNFEAILDTLASRQLDVSPLISHRFHIVHAEKAYALLGSKDPSLGIMLDYSQAEMMPDAELRRATLPITERPAAANARGAVGEGRLRPSVAFIGAGNFASAVLIPAFKAAGARLRTVASTTGVSGLQAARKHGFDEVTTDVAEILARADVDAIVIATRHDSHARLVVDALRSGKHVFVEKPLALHHAELDEIEFAYRERAKGGKCPILTVGFNRRFAPQVERVKSLLTGVTERKAFVMTVNAGAIPTNHWTHDAEVGGGRVIGEACHFIDLLRFLAGVPLRSHRAVYMKSRTADTVTLQFGFADGSIGSVHYFANGSRAYPKETLEIFVAGRVLRLDNFRKLSGYSWPGFKHMNIWRQNKGHMACVAAFVDAISGDAPPSIPFDEIMEVNRVAIDLSNKD